MVEWEGGVVRVAAVHALGGEVATTEAHPLVVEFSENGGGRPGDSAGVQEGLDNVGAPFDPPVRVPVAVAGAGSRLLVSLRADVRGGLGLDQLLNSRAATPLTSSRPSAERGDSSRRSRSRWESHRPLGRTARSSRTFTRWPAVLALRKHVQAADAPNNPQEAHIAAKSSYTIDVAGPRPHPKHSPWV